MSAQGRAEVWLRGPVEGVPALLQPVAHALLQVGEEAEVILSGYPEDRLWTRPGGVASVGFHLRHIPGVIDRLFTYARGEQLSEEQLETLRREGEPPGGGDSLELLLGALHERIERAVDELAEFEERTLADPMEVGRARLPSTVLGLLFHAAEHAQRHMGQLLVTARIQRESGSGGSH